MYFSIQVVRAQPFIEIRQAVPCRAIRGSSISVSGALPPLWRSHTHTHLWILRSNLICYIIQYYSILYDTLVLYITLCCITLHYIISYYILLCYNIIYIYIHYIDIILCCLVLFCIVLYYIILYYITVYYVILRRPQDAAGAGLRTRRRCCTAARTSRRPPFKLFFSYVSVN